MAVPRVISKSEFVEIQAKVDNFPTSQLNLHDTEILRAAQLANPHMFKAIIQALDLMSDRRTKYSGIAHPYFNFADMSRRTGLSLRTVLRFYRNIKKSRLSVGTEDFGDEGYLDTLLDLINYAAISAGAEIDNLTVTGIFAESDGDEAVDHTARTIMVDLDGVLNKFIGWTGVYEQYEITGGALEFVTKLADAGWRVIIFTARPDEDLLNVYTWAEENGLFPAVHSITNKKLPAAHYIDDRAIRFDGDYNTILQSIKFSKPHWDST